MKKVILFLLFFDALSNAQFDTLILNPETKEYSFSEVIEVEGFTQDQLYTNANIWFVDAFRSANHVIQMNDKASGILMGKGYGKFITEDGINSLHKDLYFTIKVQVKDGRYKYEVRNMYFHSPAFYMGSTYFSSWERSAEDMLDPKELFKKNGEIKPLKSYYYYGLLEVIEYTVNELKRQMGSGKDVKDGW